MYIFTPQFWLHSPFFVLAWIFTHSSGWTGTLRGHIVLAATHGASSANFAQKVPIFAQSCLMDSLEVLVKWVFGHHNFVEDLLCCGYSARFQERKAPPFIHIIETLIQELFDFVSPGKKFWLIPITARLVIIKGNLVDARVFESIQIPGNLL